MKRKSFVSILIVLLALFSLTRCKLAEVETIDAVSYTHLTLPTT